MYGENGVDRDRVERLMQTDIGPYVKLGDVPGDI